jgi:hypothetical protein
LIKIKNGDILICVKLDTDSYNGGDKDNERLILGERYKVTDDLDVHFPDRVCVKLKGPYYFHQEWVPIECFADISAIRNFKLKQLGI